MPVLIKFYICIYLIFTISNLGYWLYSRGKLWIILYDFTSGLTLTIFMIAYYRPVLKDKLTVYHVLFFLFVIGFEFYMSTWGKPEKMGIDMPEELGENELETAKSVSILFSAPAYIIGGLLSYEIISDFFTYKQWGAL